MRTIIFLFFLGIAIHAVKGLMELGDECEDHEDCEDFTNAICNSSNLCDCQPGYVASEDKYTCLPVALKLGDECEVAEQCANIPKAECRNNSCIIPQVVSKPPVLAKPTEECTKGANCSGVLKRVCNNNTCATELPVIQPKSVLSPIIPDVFILGKPCVNDTNCNGEGSACVDKQCKCKEDFVPAQNLKSCLPKAKSVGDKCSETAQCLSLNGSICENEKCTHLIQKMLNNLGEKLPTIKLNIGSTCQTDSECEHMTNALCLENVCQCKDGYVTSVFSNSCLLKAKKEGDPCDIDKQCEDVKGSTCVQKKCVKPGVVSTKLGKSNGGSTIAISQLLAAILFAKSLFV